MLRILTWNSNTGFDKMPSKDVPTFASDIQTSLIPCASVPSKRKHSFDTSIVSPIERHAVKAPSVVEPNAQSDTKLTNAYQDTMPSSDLASYDSFPQLPVMENAAVAIPVATSPPLSKEAIQSREEARLATMRQTISSQLSLEILLKHRELRLIDQELAKCQVALEQLRRCSEIPYPATQLPSDQVSSGKGAAIRKSTDKRAARSPAPWGVTEGPYTRHYARWLLQDPHFDGGEFGSAVSTTIGSTPFTGRSTRGHVPDFAQMVGKTSRSQRAANHAFLPNGFAEPKQKPTGPMILKRKSDGKMVKLVCQDCGRHDFGSAQGFINHCRIGHQRNYASHDAAAEGCGQPLDADEAVTAKETPGESQPQTPVTVPTTPLVMSAASSSVQPLVRSAHLLPRDNVPPASMRGGYVPKAERKPRKPKKTSSAKPQCSSTPHLSAFIQDRGVDLNLQELVTEAKSKLVSDDIMDMYDDDMECDSPVVSQSGNSRHPQVAGHKKPMKSSGKSIMSQSRREDANSFSSFNTSQTEGHLQGLMGLVPSPTNESTQAPSLIDDDEEMDPQSPPSSDEIDESDILFHIRDDDHPEEGHEMRSTELQAPPATCTANTTPVPPNLPSTTPLPRPLSSKGEMRVQFIAEHPNKEGQSDKKRRRIGD